MRLPSERAVPDPTEYRGRTFDARPQTDDRSLNYPIRAFLPTYTAPRRKMWRRGAVLDQGPDGACVGHGWASELAGDPVRVSAWSAVRWPQTEDAPGDVHAAAHWIYHDAQRRDVWPGEDYSGTSVLGGAKSVQALGLIDGYRWAQTALDLRDTLITTGPVVIAIPWLSGMFDHTSDGEVRIEGDEVGWHCVLLNGYDPALSLGGRPRREMLRLQNSWGTGWAAHGSAYVDFAALWALLEGADGDACVPMGRRAT